MRSTPHRVPDPKRIEVIDPHVAEVLRRRTPAERVAMISECNRTMRLLLESGLRHQFPEWDDARVRTEVNRRMSRGAD